MKRYMAHILVSAEKITEHFLKKYRYMMRVLLQTAVWKA